MATLYIDLIRYISLINDMCKGSTCIGECKEHNSRIIIILITLLS